MYLILENILFSTELFNLYRKVIPIQFLLAKVVATKSVNSGQSLE